jgi:hypothetical protein
LARVLGEGYTESEAVEYVAGFLDAEGCFSLRLRRKPEYTLGFYFVPIITAGNCSKTALTFINKTLNVGYIHYQKHGRVWVWKTEKAKDCVKVAGLIDDKLKIKRRRCHIVREAAEIIFKNKYKMRHQDFLHLLRLYYSINPNKFPEKKRMKIEEVYKRLGIKEDTLFYNLSNIPMENNYRLNVNYVAGFFDGEGCFSIRIKKSNHCRLGVQTYPVIAIGNYDKAIIFGVKEFLGVGHIRCEKVGRNKDKTLWLLMIENVDDCKRVAEVLDGKLIAKKRDLHLFRDALPIFEDRRHLTPEGLLAITEIVNKLHKTS